MTGLLKSAKILMTLMILLGASGFAAGQVPLGTRHYLYLSDQRIITLELVNEQKAILNYISLGDAFEIIQAPGLLIFDSEGHPFHGHLIEVEEAADPNDRFKVTELAQPRSYAGFNIWGNYRLPAPAQEAYFQVGSRIVKLEPLIEEDFEWLAAKIGKLDLSMEDGKEMVLQAGFLQGHGKLYTSGAPEVEEIEGHFPDLELLQPVLLSSPQPALPSSFSDLPDPVLIVLSARVSRSGGLSELQVVRGVAPRLDELALQTVRNSWTFLPAISEGSIADARLTFNVVFRRGPPVRPAGYPARF
ncbi:MAG: energy transducer TonB [Acidobacteria bacterium]|nr:energy transducer TonB [Acidobacteriota bacterium]